MKIVLAPDGFKDALPAAPASEAMLRGVRRAFPQAEIVCRPIADGGEGFVDAFATLPHAERHVIRVTGPLGEPVDAAWVALGRDGDADFTAVIELAQAAGLERTPFDRRDPTATTAFGVGELIGAAMDHRVARVLLGVGGSATNDAGCGMAQALGIRFFDAQGIRFDAPIRGRDLPRITRIDSASADPRLNSTEIVVACDVTNPLFGPSGAAFVYGPQKGATPTQVETLDKGLKHIASLWQAEGRWRTDGRGFGAAGGAAGGAVCLLGAELRPGADVVLDAVGFDQTVEQADLVLTGEGRLDGQSLSGKAVLKAAQRAAKHGVPTVALVGTADADADRCLAAGLRGYEVLAPGLSAEESIARTSELLADAAERVARKFVANP
ncbi:MAG: glycerate kinase [Planctomycetota bacterium]